MYDLVHYLERNQADDFGGMLSSGEERNASLANLPCLGIITQAVQILKGLTLEVVVRGRV